MRFIDDSNFKEIKRFHVSEGGKNSAATLYVASNVFLVRLQSDFLLQLYGFFFLKGQFYDIFESELKEFMKSVRMYHAGEASFLYGH